MMWHETGDILDTNLVGVGATEIPIGRFLAILGGSDFTARDIEKFVELTSHKPGVKPLNLKISFEKSHWLSCQGRIDLIDVGFNY